MDAMIDIETLGVDNDSIILTIGCIKFDSEKRTKNDNMPALQDLTSLYLRIDKQSCLDYGLKSNPETIKWWDKQSKEAYYEAIEYPNRIKLKDALIQLSEFVKRTRYFWAQGSMDCNILTYVYRVCDLPLPWKYWQWIDSRSIFLFHNYDYHRFKASANVTSHNALNDCYTQILAVLALLSNKLVVEEASGASEAIK
jgi:hypothetical protein